MEKYESIYSFNVFDEIKNGERVYAVDRKLAEVFVVNSMDMDCFATLLHRVDADKDRYLFWKIIKEDFDDAENI